MPVVRLRRAQPSRKGLKIMPYHVYTRSGAGAIGIIVETAKDALAKAAEFLQDGHPEVAFKDLLGNVLDHAAVADLAESEEKAT